MACGSPPGPSPSGPFPPAPFALDLSSCDREPIHIPGAIQPHGILFALAGSDLRITAVSANLADHLGFEPRAVLNRPVRDLLDKASGLALQEAARHDDQVAPERVYLRLKGAVAAIWPATLQGTPDGRLLELALRQPTTELNAIGLFHLYDRATRRLQKATDPLALCQRLAEEIRKLTGYNRVKIYRFAKDWTGEVIAEARDDVMPPYLGLHFPASDIPYQARELYRRNLERQIPDVLYMPVPLVQAGTDPIDLSASTLRSVSPLHVEYLTNMGVGASMSVSIVRNDKLWGLVACHHRTPHHVPLELRQASVLLAQLAAWQLAFLEDAETMRCSADVRAIETALLQETAAGRDYREGLLRHGKELLELLQAGGMAVSRGASLTTIGETPPEDALAGLVGWLARRGPEVFETDHLAAHYPSASGWGNAAGLLAVPLGGIPDNLMVWFRPEIARTVTWGGNPEKAVEPDPTTGRLNPRVSFAAWTEAVTGRARPWQQHELAAANGLRDMVADIIVRRSLELEEINARLLRSNEELEAFAYVASHDLKEPLRQIETFSSLLERVFNNRGPPGADPNTWLEGIQASSRRLRSLIDDLTEYSRLGRHANPFAPCPLDEVLDELKTDLGASISSEPLPVLMCDRIQIRQVLQNLISNALKYRHPDRTPDIKITVEVRSAGALPGHPSWRALELRVADNGIGFDERHRSRIFEPFQRLHSADTYEGSGIGLAICRKIIDRHGGTITANSQPGMGSTFVVTLPMRPLPDRQAAP